MTHGQPVRRVAYPGTHHDNRIEEDTMTRFLVTTHRPASKEGTPAFTAEHDWGTDRQAVQDTLAVLARLDVENNTPYTYTVREVEK